MLVITSATESYRCQRTSDINRFLKTIFCATFNRAPELNLLPLAVFSIPIFNGYSRAHICSFSETKNLLSDFLSVSISLSYKHTNNLYETSCICSYNHNHFVCYIIELRTNHYPSSPLALSLRQLSLRQLSLAELTCCYSMLVN